MWCPSCGDEFREGATHCPDCGVELVSDEVVLRPAEAPRREIPEGYDPLSGTWEGPPDEFVEWLDDEGIPVLSSPDEDGRVQLYVPHSQLARAELLLAEYHDEDDDYEEVEVEFELDDLSARSRELLADGDLEAFAMLADGTEEEMLDLADRLEEAGVPVLVVDGGPDEDVVEVHVPDRCRENAEKLLSLR